MFFAWSAVDMLRIDPQVIIHKLNVLPEVKPVKQKKRRFALHVVEAEIEYPDWVTNMVMVKKANDKWRMCIDFTNLNKACLKDSLPLPSIDHLVTSL
ncbi:protein SRG1 [Gossypium australe]|uniref:Protein SRG1 n=1 Tax=Gossypium australe TaxID=47621 RepID=A0A5B6VZV3_9ROSI|nr:protein SRG1 [Gossypium australe]